MSNKKRLLDSPSIMDLKVARDNSGSKSSSGSRLSVQTAENENELGSGNTPSSSRSHLKANDTDELADNYDSEDHSGDSEKQLDDAKQINISESNMISLLK